MRITKYSFLAKKEPKLKEFFYPKFLHLQDKHENRKMLISGPWKRRLCLFLSLIGGQSEDRAA